MIFKSERVEALRLVNAGPLVANTAPLPAPSPPLVLWLPLGHRLKAPEEISPGSHMRSCLRAVLGRESAPRLPPLSVSPASPGSLLAGQRRGPPVNAPLRVGVFESLCFFVFALAY
jgi:hypothetical protein